MHLALPISDYVNDTKSVLDQALRVLNAMIDIAADEGDLASVLVVAELTQCIVQVSNRVSLPTQSCFPLGCFAAFLSRLGSLSSHRALVVLAFLSTV
jgi:hypothetical protein